MFTFNSNTCSSSLPPLGGNVKALKPLNSLTQLKLRTLFDHLTTLDWSVTGRESIIAHRVNEDEGGEMPVRDPVALEPDGHHVAVARLEAKRPGHQDVSGRARDTQKHDIQSIDGTNTAVFSLLPSPSTPAQRGESMKSCGS